MSLQPSPSLQPISWLGRISLDPSVHHGFSPLASLRHAAAQLVTPPSIAPAAPRAFSRPLGWACRPATPRNNHQPVVNTHIFCLKEATQSKIKLAARRDKYDK